ncbi:phosphate ABC transporter substrate-binding protein PstS [Aeromicrobium wangtongii]|uniref:Phosphate-binding protein n=1 Tax=Aeromicrobium wangtongii TaxID=2969247 RepID=A0ABY5MAL7_9ACTN|nr:phosphate ABC transporter substrate-binding protein PstS [Aeromicrobium wangtongii]MCD9196655.1 phosphate ABC transporter substrate-binding protein PstS [Aeromicrobium wangtongii]UUP14166.1 phosphate ABC transporter substrate-binding protein PstS [Aeromicrobium wangtongii]
MNRKNLRIAAPAAMLALALGLSACGAGNEDASAGETSAAAGDGVSGTLNGAGSSAQEAAVAAWKQQFQTANPDATVNYDPVGSGGGREQFIAGGVSFAGSDAYLTDDELAGAKKRCDSEVVEVPTYVSPIAVVYNLDGVDDLNLSPDTVAGIFAGKITTWDDAAIKADNPDAKLPSTKITPVHRSDDSGTTQNFTDYLSKAAPKVWTDEPAQTWPVKGGEAAEGTSGVISAVSGGNGTVGYADESQAGKLGMAKVKVGDEFVAPTPEAAAKVLETAKPVAGRATTDIAIDIDRTTEAAGVYPIVLASYQMACQSYPDAETADLVKAWLTYVTSPEGQDASAKAAGSAPLSGDFASTVQAAVKTIKAA